ncbi:MAG: GNAT family N-acetyltransferase [Gemmatimonadales bacterium]
MALGPRDRESGPRSRLSARRTARTGHSELERHGLGRVLLERLIAASRERGIRRVRFEVLSADSRMRNLLRDIAPDATMRYDGPTFTAEIHEPAPCDR